MARSEREREFTSANNPIASVVCRLSSVCLSLTFVRPTQLVEIIGNVSSPYNTLAIR